MTRILPRAILALALGVAAAAAEPAAPDHGLAMHGAPALAPDFEHLPYANPDAPQGGSMTFPALGGFDSLNPYILRGRSPWEVRGLTFESLLGRNWDEPFTLYGLLAERVEAASDRSWVEFTLRPEARFSDGSPVTLDDVIGTMELLAEKGLPSFGTVWNKVSRVERKGPRTVRFHFSGSDREAPLIVGGWPILKMAQFEGRDFSEPGLEPLVGSGPYVVAEAEPDRFVSLRKNPDWWGAGLPFNRGRHNLDEVRVEYFRDASAQRDALRAGEIDFLREPDPALWAERYGFADGERIAKAEIGHARPSGMYGLVFNTRRPPFDDIRVRRALNYAFDFEWINRTMFGGAYERVTSYFGGSPLAHSGPAEGREREILAPHADALPEGALDAAWTPPASEGDGRDRRNLRRAAQLLQEAGWTVRDGVLRDADGEAFAFEILLGDSADERVVNTFADALRTLGVEARVRTVDAAQYQKRRDAYDYDMIVNRWAMSLSPGNEQRFYWGGEGVERPGTRNYMGVDNPAVEASIDALLAAEDAETFRAAARALDRALTAGVYVIPFWRDPVSRIAYSTRLAYPEPTPLYGDWIGWSPDVWWSRE
jgi:peptide/nickel transport system substrate-binding protein